MEECAWHAGAGDWCLYYSCRAQRHLKVQVKHACYSKVRGLAGKTVHLETWNKNVRMEALEDSFWAEDPKALKLVDGVVSSRGLSVLLISTHGCVCVGEVDSGCGCEWAGVCHEVHLAGALVPLH